MLFKNFLIRLYSKKGISRRLVIKILNRLEGGQFYSRTLRTIFKKYHGVEIGMYTHGACFSPGNFDKFTVVGRYCSIAYGVHVFNRNHPIDFKSSHAFFFNNKLAYCSRDPVEYTPLEIGSDVWFGHNALILPNVKHIGHGAVVGAGSVVNKDIPPYGIVVGHPARLVQYRFPKEIIEELLSSKWWEYPIEEIHSSKMNEFTQPYEKYLRIAKT